MLYFDIKKKVSKKKNIKTSFQRFVRETVHLGKWLLGENVLSGKSLFGEVSGRITL